MSRTRLRTALATCCLALAAAGCDDSRDRPSPVGPSLMERREGMRLAVDGAGSELVQLALRVEGRDMEVPAEFAFEAKEGEPLVGAIDLPPGEYGVYAEAFDREGQRTNAGKGKLTVGERETPQVELALAPEPGAKWGFVRIGTYRLTASRAIIPVRPKQEVQLEIGLVDADGRELPIEKGTLTADFPEWPRRVEPIEVVYGGYKAFLAWIQQRGSPIGVMKICRNADGSLCIRIVLDDNTDPTRVSAGGHVTCVLRGTGSARCWGPNGNGETGETMGATHLAGYDFTAIATGTSNHALGTHVCAVTRSGGVWCWGRNTSGQLGNGAIGGAYDKQPVPQQVPLPAAAKGVAVGQRHSCALMVDGTVYCWGEATMGQLGDGSYRTNTAGPGNVTTPVLVNTPIRFTSITAGNAHTCGLDVNGGAYCWGRNVERQAGVSAAQSVNCNWQGLGSYWESCVPLPTWVQGTSFMTALEAGTFDTCVRSNVGDAFCWGNSVTGQANGPVHTPTQVAGSVTWAHVSIGGGFSCGFDMGGHGRCWGANYGGQLGTGTPTYPSWTPVAVTGGSQWMRMDSGDDHACGIRTTDKRVLCWGIDNSGLALGYAHAGTTFSATPQLVTVAY